MAFPYQRPASSLSRTSFAQARSRSAEEEALMCSALTTEHSPLLQDLGQPILSLDAGIEAKSFVARNGEVTQVLRSSGDAAAGLQAAPHKIMGAR